MEQVTAFFDPATNTFSYVVADIATGHCAIIDPVLDIDMAAGRISTESADQLISHIQQFNLTVDYILETHVHADHLTASHYLKRELGGKTGIGDCVGAVQSVFAKVFNAVEDFYTDGRQFDCQFADGDQFKVGALTFEVLHTPGHTPACVTYRTEASAFVGDTLFMPDYGTARTDFPGGDAGTLFDSIQRILALPADTTLYLCHDYLAASPSPANKPSGPHTGSTGARTKYCEQTTVAAELRENIHLRDQDRSSFIALRESRDANLAAPRLLLPSIQVNMRAGELPAAESNDVHYLKIPLKVAQS